MCIVAPFNNSITTNVKNGTIKVATTTKPILSVVSLFLIVLIKFDIVFVFSYYRYYYQYLKIQYINDIHNNLTNYLLFIIILDNISLLSFNSFMLFFNTLFSFFRLTNLLVNSFISLFVILIIFIH